MANPFLQMLGAEKKPAQKPKKKLKAPVALEGSGSVSADGLNKRFGQSCPKPIGVLARNNGKEPAR